tara:strand:+ start:6792 stop:7667 length:876 start_codon:yes stop_codon:yes gene_type:complete
MNIGVIGNGFVGNAVAAGFSYYTGDKVSIKIYDVDPEKSTHTYTETVFSDYVFVCLPTPMCDEEGGECNLSIIEDFFEELPTTAEGVFIIKSTVPIGTTKSLCEKYPHLKIVHNPEFLTAKNAEYDFLNTDRHVIGGEKDLVESVSNLYKACFPISVGCEGTTVPIYKMTSDESEAVKYFANTYLASKVILFNEMKLLCDSMNMNWDGVRKGVISDKRVGISHTQVPGPDGELGFGGICFAKDINALLQTMEENDVNPIVMKSVWEQNKNIREDWDWANIKSAVLPKEGSK